MRAAAPSEVLKGTLCKVRYSGERFFTVATLEDGDGREQTIVGTMIGVSPGEVLRLDGRWVEDARFGRQFRFAHHEVLVPEDHQGVVKWLSSVLPDVGFSRALGMVQRFGAQGVFEAIEKEPQKLCQVPGITPERAQAIHQSYLANKTQKECRTFLLRYGLTDAQSARVIEKFGMGAVEATLRENPYVLMKVERIGFKTADQIARRMGVAQDHPERARAGVLHMLEVARQEGHCFVPRHRVIARAWTDIEVPEGASREAVARMLEALELVEVGEGHVYLAELEQRERWLAEHLERLLQVAA